MVTATIRERVRVVRQPRVAATLLVTTVWAVGTYAVYSFIALLLAAVTPLRGPQVGYALSLWGASAGVGLIIGGNATDRLGVRAVVRTSLCVLASALAALSTLAHVLPPAIALPPVLLAMIAWGLSAWAFFPAQQAGLIEIVGVKLAPIVLSLNASFMYLGFSLGAAVGSFTLVHATVTNLGWTGAACEMAALTLFLATRAATPAQGHPARDKASSCAFI
jgi:predicted MFS family arabinose efflux permease